MVHAAHDLSDGGGVGDHQDGALDLGEVASGHHGGRLVVDPDLEPGGTPVDESDGPLCLDGTDGGVHILRNDVTAVHHAAGHVLSVTGVAFDHLVGGFEDGVGDLGDGEELVVGDLSRDDGGKGAEGEVDTGVGDQVGLELGKVDVQGTVEPQGGSDRGDALGEQSVEVGVGGSLNAEVSAADVVEGLVVNHEGDVGVFHHGVGAEDGVVGFDHSGGDLGRGVDGELDLRLFAVVDGEGHQSPPQCHRRRSGTG